MSILFKNTNKSLQLTNILIKRFLTTIKVIILKY